MGLPLPAVILKPVVGDVEKVAFDIFLSVKVGVASHRNGHKKASPRINEATLLFHSNNGS